MYFMKMNHDPTVSYPKKAFQIHLIVSSLLCINTYNYMVESLLYTNFIYAESVKIW